MSEVISNEALGGDFYLLKVRQRDSITQGQFYMLRAWGNYPLLSRPISVYDCDEGSITFLYKVVGEGTMLLSRLKKGDEVECQGPYGNGFPLTEGKVALVGGGVGIAPLYLLAKRLYKNSPGCTSPGCAVDIYLGFSGEPVLEESFRAVCTSLQVKCGGLITDILPENGYDAFYVCGPEPMMKAVAQRVCGSGAPCYLSLESRMGCGIGACLVCSCKTTGGNRRVCKDGPVFLASEVVF